MLLQIIAYTIDCQVPGEGIFKVAPQLSTGVVLGRFVEVEIMETERKGRLAACSQPLFTSMAGLRDWYAPVEIQSSPALWTLLGLHATLIIAI